MMQRFDNEKGRRRKVDFLNMREEEADIFYSQFDGLSRELQQKCAEELKEQIGKKNREYLQWILVIYSKVGEIIGRIEVTSFNYKEAAVRIQIPKKDIALKYGIEVVEEFLQICKDNHYFETVELDTTFVAKIYCTVCKCDGKNIKLNVA